MPAIPSFKDETQLYQAIVKIFEQSGKIQLNPDDHIVSFIVKHLMNDAIAQQCSRRMRYRHFRDAVEAQYLYIDERLKLIERITKELIGKFGEFSVSHKDDLLAYIKEELLRPINSEYLVGDVSRSYIRTKISWLLRSRIKKLKDKYTHKSVPKTAEDLIDEGKDPAKELLKKPKKQVKVLVSAEALKSSTDDKASILDNFPDPNDDAKMHELVEEEADRRQRMQVLIELICTRLKKQQRSAIVMRLWGDLVEFADQSELAVYVNSPLTLKERIERLDQINDDQKRMVKVAFPELEDESKAQKDKLATLNRASNHAITKLTELMNNYFEESDHG